MVLVLGLTFMSTLGLVLGLVLRLDGRWSMTCCFWQVFFFCMHLANGTAAFPCRRAWLRSKARIHGQACRPTDCGRPTQRGSGRCEAVAVARNADGSVGVVVVVMVVVIKHSSGGHVVPKGIGVDVGASSCALCFAVGI